MSERPAQVPLSGQLAMVGCGGLIAAAGIGLARVSVYGAVMGGGFLTVVFLAMALGVSLVLEGAALLVFRGTARLRRGDARPLLVGFGTLLLGGGGVVALNSVLTAANAWPPFGVVSVLLLCLPYPLAYALLVLRTARSVAVTRAAVILLGGLAAPVHAAQEQLAAGQWLAQHPTLDRRLLRTVDWPGSAAPSLELGPFGLRSELFFQDSNIDGLSDAVVEVRPEATNPCTPLPVIADGYTGGSTDGSEQQSGQAITVPVTRCAQTKPGVWQLTTDDGWRGLAERRDGVLLVLSVDDNRPDDDLAAVARTLHPLGDHGLWSQVGPPPGWAWLLY